MILRQKKKHNQERIVCLKSSVYLPKSIIYLATTLENIHFKTEAIQTFNRFGKVSHSLHVYLNTKRKILAIVKILNEIKLNQNLPPSFLFRTNCFRKNARYEASSWRYSARIH